MKFKNIVTYYLDGKPNGVRRCRIEGSVIEALVIPREAVKDAKALADVLPKHGIYFLIEDKEGIDLPKMYAGQTTNGLGRLYDHKANKWRLYRHVSRANGNFSPRKRLGGVGNV